MDRKRNGGFTLIEAAVAIAVVAILSGIIVPLVVKNLQDSQVARAKNDVQVIAAAVASQLKDTGSRPTTAAGPGSATGVGYSVWGSGGADPSAGAAMTANCTFTNLFTNARTLAAAQDLFFAPAGSVTSAAEFSYRGPYMASDVAAKSDPWGTRYLIVGYNAAGQTANGPIWVVSCGPDRSTLVANVPAAANPPAVWGATAEGEDDIIMRVN